MNPAIFDLQGHRGARGLKPENTLPGFEAALDLGVTTVETNLHLTQDGTPIVIHDPIVSERLCRLAPGSSSPSPAGRPLVRSLTLAQMRGYRADCNPDRPRFPLQDPSVTSLSQLFAETHGIDPLAPPTLAELFAFVDAYATELGATAGKTAAQRRHAGRFRFDVELKLVPFRPELVGDSGSLERQVVDVTRTAGMLERTTIRSFDHRSVQRVGQLERRLTTAVLVAGTAPVAPAELVRQAGAQIYCPDYEFLDEAQVQQLHEHGVRVVPWTVNEAADWERLLSWGVDGITTDFPDRLAGLLHSRGIAFQEAGGGCDGDRGLS